MALEFSLAHLTVLDASPLELIEIAHRAGYNYVGLRLTPVAKGEEVYPLLTDLALQRDVKSLLAATGISILDIELIRLGRDDEPEDYLEVLEVSADLGASHLLCQTPDADRARAADRFAKLCELAEPFGLTADLEFPTWTETATLNDAIRIVEQAGMENGSILVDTLHFARSDSTLRRLAKVSREWFHFAQLCDADATIPDSVDGLIHTARCDRRFLGEGGINVREIVNAIPVVPYSLEIPNDRLRTSLGNEEYARRALETARHYLAQSATVTNRA